VNPEIGRAPDSRTLLLVLLTAVDDVGRGVRDPSELPEIAAEVRARLDHLAGARWTP
jgi:hypothetical protein